MWEKIRSSDNVLPLLLIWALVALTAQSIGRANLVRAVDMTSILMISGTLGVLAGYALARSRFPTATALIYALVYGIFVLGWVIGRTYDIDLLWRERIADMVARQISWGNTAFGGGTARDPLVFAMHTTLVLWLLGYSVSWWTFRRARLWLVVLPCGMVMLSVIYYASPWLVWFLALYCLVTLLYIAETHLRENKQVWQAARVRYHGTIDGSFMRSSLLIALFALALVWRAPALPANAEVGDAISRVNEPWRQVRDNWQRLYSALNAQSQGTADPFRDTLSLGGPRNPGNALIMDVFVDEQLPYAYWRAAVLDRYEGGQWHVAQGDTVTVFPDDEPLNVGPDESRQNVRQIYVNYVPNAGTIHGAPEPVDFDRQVMVRVNDDSGYVMPAATRSRYLLQLGDRYEVVSRLSVADETSLRNASVDYSAPIAAHYLDVPPEISQRTRDLAVQLTAPYTNPYDQALAVQNFLRSQIDYNDQVDAPPIDVEEIDYFLFETREGYCNYYASAMAMMLRIAGVPTRLARGYAAGEFNADNNVYRVSAEDAHTWPEVYFEGYGWIQFEPTVIISAIERPRGEGDEFPFPDRDEPQFDDEFPAEAQDELTPEELAALLGDQQEEAQPADTFLGGLGSGAVFWQAISALLLLTVAGVLVLVGDRYNRRIEGSIEGSYGRLEMWARWLGLNMQVSQTPYERAQLLSGAVPEGKESIVTIVNEFVRKRFSPDKQNDLFFNPLDEWRRLRPLLLRKGLRRRFGRKK